MEKAVYNLFLIYENSPLSGGHYKILGIKEGHDINDYLSKWDKVLESRGHVEMFGDVDQMEFLINVHDDYELTIGEAKKYGKKR